MVSGGSRLLFAVIRQKDKKLQPLLVLQPDTTDV